MPLSSGRFCILLALHEQCRVVTESHVLYSSCGLPGVFRATLSVKKPGTALDALLLQVSLLQNACPKMPEASAIICSSGSSEALITRVAPAFSWSFSANSRATYCSLVGGRRFSRWLVGSVACQWNCRGPIFRGGLCLFFSRPNGGT